MMDCKKKLVVGGLIAPFLMLAIYKNLPSEAETERSANKVIPQAGIASLDMDAAAHTQSSSRISAIRMIEVSDTSPTGTKQEALALIDQLNHAYQLPVAEALKAGSALLDHASVQVAEHALDLMVFLALEKGQQDAVVDLLTARAADPGYALREMALVKGARLGKTDMLPVVTTFIDEQALESDEATRDRAYATAIRALSLMKSAEAVPHLKQLLNKTKAIEARRNNFEALASIQTPESLAVLKEQVEVSTGANQTHSVLALARVNQVETTNFLAQLIESNTLSEATLTELARSTHAADIFGKTLSHQSLADAQKIGLLDTLLDHASDSHKQARTKMTEQMIRVMSETDNVEMQVKALAVVSELGLENTASVLQGYFDSEQPEVRKQAIKRFAKYSNENNYKSVSRFLWDADQDVRRNALVSMEMFMGQDDRELLQKASTHEDQFIQQHAQAILQQLNQPQENTL